MKTFSQFQESIWNPKYKVDVWHSKEGASRKDWSHTPFNIGKAKSPEHAKEKALKELEGLNHKIHKVEIKKL